MTIYRLYVQNGNRAGFWVQHRTWTNACAIVRSVGGQRTGQLPGAAAVQEEAQIIADTFDVRSGRRVQAAAAPHDPQDRHYTLIAEPWWSHQAVAQEYLDVP
ncbi:MAG: hypothetical protein ABIP55_06465 [Tepidisphaeraceae bacterium]